LLERLVGVALLGFGIAGQSRSEDEFLVDSNHTVWYESTTAGLTRWFLRL
jgi:hypothetical protein